jgi:hypothetical protein
MHSVWSRVYDLARRTDLSVRTAPVAPWHMGTGMRARVFADFKKKQFLQSTDASRVILAGKDGASPSTAYQPLPAFTSVRINRKSTVP